MHMCILHASAWSGSTHGIVILTQPSALHASLNTSWDSSLLITSGKERAASVRMPAFPEQNPHGHASGHAARSLLQSDQLQTVIDPSNSAGSSALNKQQCVADTTLFPYSAVGFLTFRPDTDEGCAAALIAGAAIYTSNECFIHRNYRQMYFQPGRSSCSSSTMQAEVAGLTNAWWFENVTDICDGSDLTDDCHQAYGWAFATLNVSYPASWVSLNLSAVSNPVPGGILNTIGYVGMPSLNHPAVLI